MATLSGVTVEPHAAQHWTGHNYTGLIELILEYNFITFVFILSLFLIFNLVLVLMSNAVVIVDFNLLL